MINRGWVGLALAAVLSSAASAAPRPESAPSSFTTNNYELTVRIPHGLFHCPYPPDWVGSDHGIVIYLVEPRTCDPAGPIAAGAEAKILPRITLYYSYNAADIDLPGGTSGPARSNSEWLPGKCPAPAHKHLFGQHLLGGPAVACTHWLDHGLSLSIGTLYMQASGPNTRSAEAPDSEVRLSLDTTPQRVSHDMLAYRAIADSLRVCRSSDRPALPARPPCPAFVPW